MLLLTSPIARFPFLSGVVEAIFSYPVISCYHALSPAPATMAATDPRASWTRRGCPERTRKRAPACAPKRNSARRWRSHISKQKVKRRRKKKRTQLEPNRSMLAYGENVAYEGVPAFALVVPSRFLSVLLCFFPLSFETMVFRNGAVAPYVAFSVVFGARVYIASARTHAHTYNYANAKLRPAHAHLSLVYRLTLVGARGPRVAFWIRESQKELFHICPEEQREERRKLRKSLVFTRTGGRLAVRMSWICTAVFSRASLTSWGTVLAFST